MDKEPLERIADALETLVELARPKQVNMEAMLREATEALCSTNPGFKKAFDMLNAMELKQGDNANAVSRIGN